MSDVVLTESDGDVFTITINRPDRRNSISTAVVHGMIDALNVASDDAARVVVVTGAGEKAFCAGGDIGDFADADGFYQMHQARGTFVKLLAAMKRFDKPIIARVNGHALGGGFGLALACDLIVASDNATFGLPEIKVGVFPMMIMPVVIRNVGRKRALELMFTGGRISAEKGAEWGFVNRCVAADDLDDATHTLAMRIASFSPVTLALGRSAFYRIEDMAFEPAVSSLHNDLSITAMTEDAAEGVMAFLSGREPEWKGK